MRNFVLAIGLMFLLGLPAEAQLFNSLWVINAQRTELAGLHAWEPDVELQAAAEYKVTEWAAGRLSVRRGRRGHNLYRGAWPGNKEGIGITNTRNNPYGYRITGCYAAHNGGTRAGSAVFKKNNRWYHVLIIGG